MIRIQRQPFSIEQVLKSVRTPRAGAVVSFIGTVRKEGQLRALAYESYDEMAVKKLEELRRKAIKRFGLIEASIVHRKGRLKIGEKVVIVAASAPHRKEAFEGCEWLIAELKKVVPIWKKEE